MTVDEPAARPIQVSMSLRTVHEALNVLEEAIELGEQADVIEATAGIGAALGRTPSGAEVCLLYTSPSPRD